MSDEIDGPVLHETQERRLSVPIDGATPTLKDLRRLVLAAEAAGLGESAALDGWPQQLVVLALREHEHDRRPIPDRPRASYEVTVRTGPEPKSATQIADELRSHLYRRSPTLPAEGKSDQVPGRGSALG